mgnify:CR=1 FL=1
MNSSTTTSLPEAPKERHFPPASPALVALLKVLLAAKSEEHHVAPKLLATGDDLDRLAVHIAEFSLAGIHSLRTQQERDQP